MARTGVFVKNQDTSGREPEAPADPHVCLVETYSGSRLHEAPRRFTFQDQWLEVQQVLACWQEPDMLVFLLAAMDNRTFLLKYHQGRDAWEVRLYRAFPASSG